MQQGREPSFVRRVWSPIVMLALGGAILQCPAVSAHQLVPEPAVEMYLQPQNGRLLVVLRVPTTALAEANLPRLTNGTLDLPAVANRFPVIAAEIADSLEIKQGNITLERPTARATISPLADRSFATFAQTANRVGAAQSDTEGAPEADVFLDFELGYMASSSGPFSVRVNPFRAQGVPVRTIAHYVAASGERLEHEVDHPRCRRDRRETRGGGAAPRAAAPRGEHGGSAEP